MSFFELPDRFQGMAQRAVEKRRSQFPRDLRNLQDRYRDGERDRGPDGAAFAGFAAFHDRQWQAMDRAGISPTGQEAGVLQRPCGSPRKRAADAAVRTIWQRPDLLATQFALVAGRIAHWRLPARDSGPQAERLSIGKVGLVLMIEELIDVPASPASRQAGATTTTSSPTGAAAFRFSACCSIRHSGRGGHVCCWHGRTCCIFSTTASGSCDWPPGCGGGSAAPEAALAALDQVAGLR